MSFRHADILSAAQFSRAQIEQWFARADDLAARLARGERLRTLDGKMLATVFYEPSIRTRLAFEAAMQRLGGGVLSLADAKTATAISGETLPDVIRAVAHLADVIVLRHPDAGAARVAANASAAPIINAGDGTGEHPTQALLDLYTLRAERQTLDGLRVALVGDLKHSPAVHSFARALSEFQVEFSFVTPAALAMPTAITDDLRERGFSVEETNDLARSLQTADVVYMTRVCKERFSDLKQYEKLKDFYLLTRALIEKAKPGLSVLHPLPRANEIAAEVDALPNAAYFRQVKNGVVIRMTLLADILAD